MTDEDLDRIDAEVAEHVCGIKPRQVRILGSTNTITVYTDNPAISEGAWNEYSLRIYGTPKRYTRSWSDAGEVVEKMKELGWWCQYRSPFSADDQHHAGFTPTGVTGWNGVPDHWTTAPTAPLAITLAALSACGHPWKGTT